MNLLFAIDRRAAAQLPDCLWSISQKGGAEAYDAYILHSDLRGDDMRFIRTNTAQSVTCHFIDVPEALFAGFPVSERYPLQIYYRLSAPLLLPPVLERILYLDVDITVINSLVPLYESSFEGQLFMACTHTGDIGTKFNRLRLGVGLRQDVPYVNTGVMMMNLPLLRRQLDMAAIRSYALEKQHALILPDQDILTALYGHRVKLLDAMIYNLSDRTLNFYNADPTHPKRDVDWVRQHSAIIHYLGKNKPWRDGYSGVLDVFYRESIQSQPQPQTPTERQPQVHPSAADRRYCK